LEIILAIAIYPGEALAREIARMSPRMLRAGAFFVGAKQLLLRIGRFQRWNFEPSFQLSEFYPYPFYLGCPYLFNIPVKH